MRIQTSSLCLFGEKNTVKTNEAQADGSFPRNVLPYDLQKNERVPKFQEVFVNEDTITFKETRVSEFYKYR